MNKQQMIEILYELKKELAENSQLDTYQRDKMTALADEINARLNLAEASMSGDEFLINKLTALTEGFEVKHPALTEILGRLSDMLARIGI